MLYSFILSLLSFTSAHTGRFTSPPADTTATLVVKVEDVRSEEGNISIAIYREENDFMSDDDFVQAVRVPAKSPVTEKEFQLPPGRYAVAIYHDENDSKEMEKNWLGIPKEPVGLSRDAIKGMSRPKFEDAAFDLTGRKVVSIDLRHF